MVFSLEITGFHKGAVGYMLRTKRGTFAGMVNERADGKARVYFNFECTKKSQVIFPNVGAALEYMEKRCAKKGWN